MSHAPLEPSRQQTGQHQTCALHDASQHGRALLLAERPTSRPGLPTSCMSSQAYCEHALAQSKDPAAATQSLLGWRHPPSRATCYRNVVPPCHRPLIARTWVCRTAPTPCPTRGTSPWRPPAVRAAGTRQGPRRQGARTWPGTWAGAAAAAGTSPAASS